MAELNNFNILYLLLLLLSGIAQYVNSYRGLSSPSEHAYTKRYLIEAGICSHFGGKTDLVKIGDRSHNSSLILRSTYIFDRWINRTSSFMCKFVIKVGKGQHLMAVIQNMSFRKNGDKCIDYVKFKRKDLHETEKFCGLFDRKMTNDLIDDKLQIYGEHDIKGEIETTIYVSKESLRPGDVPLNLTIVYTPYKSEDCHRLMYDNVVNYYRFLDEINSCLLEDYFCDGIYNCIPAICKDEQDCPSEIYSNGTGSKVTIGAVTTILLCFIIFIMGLWICRRQKKLCWSSDCAGPDENDDRFNNGERSLSTSANQSVPTAPMLEVSVLSSAIDKDLPPSYDSLFPEQSNLPST